MAEHYRGRTSHRADLRTGSWLRLRRGVHRRDGGEREALASSAMVMAKRRRRATTKPVLIGVGVERGI